MLRIRFIAPALALGATLLLTVTSARAQDCASAECHVERGLAARTAGDDAAAADHFHAALAIERSPRVLAQLALAEQALGRWVEAEAHLQEAMAGADPWIASHRDVLEGARTTIGTHLGQLLVSSNVEGATLRVNGQAGGTLPSASALSVEVGTAVLDVSAPGHVAVQRRTEISAGQLSRVRVDLVPIASEAPDDPAAIRNGAPAAAPGEPRPRHDGSADTLFLLGGIAAGLTGLALAATFTALVIREENVAAWNDPVRCPPFPDGRLVACPDEHSAWNTAEHWMIGAGIASGVFAALTATFFALGANQTPPSTALQIDVELGPGLAALTVSGAL